jgi:S1-C subfamily serine protease
MQDKKSNLPQFPGYVQQGQGSGLFCLAKGFKLTNVHVVEDANKVSVRLTWTAGSSLVKSCGRTKLWTLPCWLNGDGGQPIIANLPVTQLGDSDSLSVGKIVIAMGTLGGLDNTVTTGIVSGLKRSSKMVGILHKKVDYIQTFGYESGQQWRSLD